MHSYFKDKNVGPNTKKQPEDPPGTLRKHRLLPGTFSSLYCWHASAVLTMVAIY